MNYCIVAFAIVLIISIVQWFVDGRKNFHGPQINAESIKHGEIQGMAADIGDVPNRDSDDTKLAEDEGGNKHV